MGANKQSKAPAAAKSGKDSGKNDKGAKGGKGGKGAKGKGQTDGDEGKNTKSKGGQWIIPRHILCEKKSQVDKARAKIEEQLADQSNKCKQVFAEVAREFSEDKARQGGLLGKRTKGSLVPKFEEVAYELPISTDKELHMGEAKTTEGYHLIIVEDRG